MGDGNNSFFQASVREKNKGTTISKLVRENGETNTSQELEEEILEFYKNLLRQAATSLRSLYIILLRKRKQISAAQCRELIRPVSDEKILDAFESLGDRKVPGVDSYDAKFLKAAWDIVGEDVKRAVRCFFEEKKMYVAINCTPVALILKTKNAVKMRDIRPISCCTTVYRIITKIITMRLEQVISSFVDVSKSAFVSRRMIIYSWHKNG